MCYGSNDSCCCEAIRLCKVSFYLWLCWSFFIGSASMKLPSTLTNVMMYLLPVLDLAGKWPVWSVCIVSLVLCTFMYTSLIFLALMLMVFLLFWSLWIDSQCDCQGLVLVHHLLFLLLSLISWLNALIDVDVSYVLFWVSLYSMKCFWTLATVSAGQVVWFPALIAFVQVSWVG